MVYLVGILLAQEIYDHGLVVLADEFEGKGEIDGAAEVGDEQFQAVDEVIDHEMLSGFRRHLLFFSDLLY